MLLHAGGLTVPAYAAAKHGILGLTKAFSNDWSGKGINVNAIAPGYISTEMNTALIADPTRSRQILERIPSKRWGTPDDFSGAVLFLAGAGSDYVCGECLTVRFFPFFAANCCSDDHAARRSDPFVACMSSGGWRMDGQIRLRLVDQCRKIRPLPMVHDHSL
jgi:hypothetical protein